MQMASGVAWNEDYADPKSDVANLPAGTLPLFAYLRNQANEARPGDLFNYNTAETNLVGALLRAAIGNNLGSYLSQKIWQPFGMEADANWIVEQADGVEYGGCCISATLRDYGRLGVFSMRGGELADGTQVLPAGWMSESTQPSKAYEGYGYLWWLNDGPAYSGIGIFGQLIWIDPVSETIIVTQSAWDTAVGEQFRKHRWAFVRSLAAALDQGEMR
jgi:CubicO group peptidase (beta-lactamase class C family)